MALRLMSTITWQATVSQGHGTGPAYSRATGTAWPTNTTLPHNIPAATSATKQDTGTKWLQDNVPTGPEGQPPQPRNENPPSSMSSVHSRAHPHQDTKDDSNLRIMLGQKKSQQIDLRWYIACRNMPHLTPPRSAISKKCQPTCASCEDPIRPKKATYT
ncbi:hypothetical protein Nepgr_022233 [Nepenthes gracilis]|uniref:Uncharacterized protein n=1 Tax=Nepenthes gracilis TaxID=150966 RepID=A0AAD3T0J2_NEPGR|nr:hypothetical protein Nepgr_022233 [Nepenthes gracilis]